MKLKLIKILFISIIVTVLFNVGNNDVHAVSAACNPACVDGQICVNGACNAPGHAVAPTAPIAGPGSAGQISDYRIPGQTTEGSDLVKCGRAGQPMCTLCDFISGMNDIIKYLMKISIGVGLLAFTIAGVMYIVSAGDPGLKGKANTTMKNAAIGFVIIFAGWLGSKTDAQGNPTFGMRITSWGQFDCNANPNR